jgi:hypothetical protein
MGTAVDSLRKTRQIRVVCAGGMIAPPSNSNAKLERFIRRDESKKY